MFGTLKTGVINFALGLKSLLFSPESKVYVKDLRKVMTCERYGDGRKYRYPKNYDKVVEYGKIRESKDNNDRIIKDGNGNSVYELVYSDKIFRLASVMENDKGQYKEIDGKFYFTIDFLVDPNNSKVNHYNGYYEPFGFSRMDLKKHVPVFEVQKKDSKFELINFSVPIKNEEVINEKSRNGELLYTSYYKPLNIHFYEIRDHNNKLELDKSLISVPIIFATGLAKVCAKCVTFLPVRIGEYLMSKQNPIVKISGYFLFVPAAAIKNLVNMGSVMLRAPILLFVAGKEKYGDAYWTMWKYQFEECWNEVKGDYMIIEGEELEKKEKNLSECKIIGTWDKLNAMRLNIENDLEQQEDNKEFNKSARSVSEESIIYVKQTNHAQEVQDRRNSQISGGIGFK